MTELPETMHGMVLTGHGGLERLEWREDLPVSKPAKGEVLIRVGAASVNNTDINTRIGWYSKSVRGDTQSGAVIGFDDKASKDGSWSGTPLQFPRIQGADCAGEIVAVGEGVLEGRLGERVMVRTLQPRETEDGAFYTLTLGSEQDGAFAQFMATNASDAITVNSPLSDVELASFPCAFSTAEGMIQRVSLRAERVLITGASGGVGSAAIQLAKRRGAYVTAVTNPEKSAEVKALGADDTLGRNDGIPAQSFDVIIDLVGGPRWSDLIEGLRVGGRYVTAGAIAGPIVELDLRTLYLRDLSFYGCCYQPANVFTDLVRYIEKGEIRPVIAETYALRDLHAAQERFLAKSFIGKIGIQVAD